MNLYFTVQLKSSLELVPTLFSSLVAEKVGKFSNTLKDDFSCTSKLWRASKLQRKGRKKKPQQILLHVLCKASPGRSNLASVVQESSLILCGERCHVPSLDLSPLSDPVCSVNLLHLLPQCAAEVIYMVRSIN